MLHVYPYFWDYYVRPFNIFIFQLKAIIDVEKMQRNRIPLGGMSIEVSLLISRGIIASSPHARIIITRSKKMR